MKKNYDMTPIVDVLERAIMDLEALREKKPVMKQYRVWMKRTKDAVEPDYFIDTVAENASKAALDAEAVNGDYADLSLPLTKIR
jgi:hypothetical protein